MWFRRKTEAPPRTAMDFQLEINDAVNRFMDAQNKINAENIRIVDAQRRINDSVLLALKERQ